MECSHYLRSVSRVTICQFSLSHFKISPDSLTKSNHAKEEWSHGKVVSVCGVGYQFLEQLSFVNEDSPEGKVVWRKERHKYYGK